MEMRVWSLTRAKQTHSDKSKLNAQLVKNNQNKQKVKQNQSRLSDTLEKSAQMEEQGQKTLESVKLLVLHMDHKMNKILTEIFFSENTSKLFNQNQINLNVNRKQAIVINEYKSLQKQLF